MAYLSAPLFIVAAVLATASYGKHVEGFIRSTDRFVYIDRFCARAEDAVADVFFRPVTGSANINLYVDKDSSWFWVYPRRKTEPCMGLLNKSQLTMWYSPEPRRINVYSSRDRWWYFAVTSCYSTAPIDVYYNITFLNPTKLSRHFSADEIGVLETTIAFAAGFFVLTCWTWYGWIILKNKKHQYGVTKRLAIAVLLEFVSIILNLVHYGKYAKDGEGVKVLRQIAFFLSISSEMVFLVLIFFLAKGYKISGRRLTHKRLMIVIFLPFPILYFALYLYSIFGIDPASTIYIYETVPGYLIIALNLVAFVVFILLVFRTMKLEKNRDKWFFYLFFGPVYSLYFLSVPIVVLIMHFVSPWSREKFVVLTDYVIKFVAYSFMSILFSPPPFRNKFTDKMKTDTGFDNVGQVFPDTF